MMEKKNILSYKTYSPLEYWLLAILVSIILRPHFVSFTTRVQA